MDSNVYGVSLGGDKNILKLDCGGVCTTLVILRYKLLNHTL